MPTSLNTFSLNDLAQFKSEKTFPSSISSDQRIFYAGRDNCHGVLRYLLAATKRSLFMNMFGYDDPELNRQIEELVTDDKVFVQGTLDKSQASGAHESKILATWSPLMRASFAIGETATHQILHTKGGVCDGLVAWEGSMNWSLTGEGFGPKSQFNTLAVYTNAILIHEFTTALTEAHTVALHQEAKAKILRTGENYVNQH